MTTFINNTKEFRRDNIKAFYAKKAAARTAPKVNTGKWKEDSIITVKALSNPKKAGSAAHTRFELYKTGMTVKEALLAGIKTIDLAWDSAASRGFISVSK